MTWSHCDMPLDSSGKSLTNGLDVTVVEQLSSVCMMAVHPSRKCILLFSTTPFISISHKCTQHGNGNVPCHNNLSIISSVRMKRKAYLCTHTTHPTPPNCQTRSTHLFPKMHSHRCFTDTISGIAHITQRVQHPARDNSPHT